MQPPNMKHKRNKKIEKLTEFMPGAPISQQEIIDKLNEICDKLNELEEKQ